jgi:hypothetical protein
MDQRTSRNTVVTTIQTPYAAYSGTATTRTREPNAFFASAMMVTRYPRVVGRDESVGLNHCRCIRPQVPR